MRIFSQKLIAVILILCVSMCLACQKKQLDLAEAKPAADAPEYTVKADVNVPGGVVEAAPAPAEQKAE
jgi:hypothetical protein